MQTSLAYRYISCYSITGPFTHWTALGVAYDDDGAFFRVSCVGRSSRTNQPKLICVEFNESDLRIKEISWSSGGPIGLSLNLSYEGLSAFSAPFLGDASNEQREFGERVSCAPPLLVAHCHFWGRYCRYDARRYDGHGEPRQP